MTEIMLSKEYGSLRPIDEEGFRVLGNIGAGVVVVVDVKDVRRRSGRQLRFWFGILNVVWENNKNLQEFFKGNFENYRKRVIIGTGRCDIIPNKDGTVDRFAHSIAFGKMPQDEFTGLVDDTFKFFETELQIEREPLEREVMERVGKV